VSSIDVTAAQEGTALARRAADRLRGPVLITGATGFIGSNVTRALLDHGANVHIVVRPESDAWRLQDVASGLHVHVAAMTDHEGLHRAFASARPCVVFHLATPRGDDKGAGRRILDETVRSAECLVRLVAQHSVERLIVAGSSLEYGPSDLPHREDAVLVPTTAHGVAKARTAVLLSQAAAQEGTPVCVLRLFHVYGPWESAHRLLPTALRAAYDGVPLPLTYTGVRRDWVHVDDVVDALLRAAGLDGRGEVFNIGTGREYSNEEVVASVAEVTGRRIETLIGTFPPRVTDAAHRRADWSRAAQAMGWSPRHDLALGIRSTNDWWRMHPTAWSELRGVRPVVC
jgi:nucleoside-diphosphate-sugar epimerase